MAYTIPFIAYTTSRFGDTAGRTSPHRGHDVAPGGQDFPSWVNGVVVTAGWQSCLGYRVVVKNRDDGYYIGVSHLANIKVRVGQSVSIGTALGNIGNTGSCSAGRHAHITVSPSSAYPESGTVVDPVIYARTAGGGGSNVVSGYGYGLTSAAQKSLQALLTKAGLYSGAIDGVFGPSSVSGMQTWLKRNGYLASGYVVDGQPGKVYAEALQKLARDKGGYTGPIDGVIGTVTSDALRVWADRVVSAPTPTPAPSGVDWKAWQTFLQKYGYTGPIDGVPGAQTYTALQKFLVNFGYSGPQDGVPGEQTWEAFKKAVAAGYPNPATTPGAPTNVDWAAWQRFLINYGYSGPADGVPGIGTYTALQRFLSQKFGYTGPIDGEPGEQTWAAFAKAVAAGYPAAGTVVDPVPEPTPTEYKAFGIDVATTQRDIDFAKAKSEGVEFVIVKMGGLNVSPQYVAPYYHLLVDGVRKNNLHLGHYYVIGQPKTGAGDEDPFYSPEQQADYFVDNLYSFDVTKDVLALDNERLNANAAFWTQDKVLAFVNQVIKRTGIPASRIWVYAGASDWRAHQPWDKLVAKGIKVWWAAYGSSPTGKTPDHEPSLQGSVPEAHVHQYTSTARVAGYELDGNVSKYPVSVLFAQGTVTQPIPDGPDEPTDPVDPEEPTDPSTPDTGVDLTPERVAAIAASLSEIADSLKLIIAELREHSGNN